MRWLGLHQMTRVTRASSDDWGCKATNYESPKRSTLRIWRTSVCSHLRCSPMRDNTWHLRFLCACIVSGNMCSRHVQTSFKIWWGKPFSWVAAGEQCVSQMWFLTKAIFASASTHFLQTRNVDRFGIHFSTMGTQLCFFGLPVQICDSMCAFN